MFTSGMSLVDSLDSVIMAYSYTGILERKKGLRLWEKKPLAAQEIKSPAPANVEPDEKKVGDEIKESLALPALEKEADEITAAQAQMMRLKQYTTSNLGITLTLMSIVVAFTCVFCHQTNFVLR